MNWIDTNTLIAICTCAIGLTQFILWKHIAKAKSFEAEKGKNLATKEDIGEITKEIKSVESRFIDETEKLKSKLTILANVQTDVISMERNAIIEINKSLFLWINSVLNIPDIASSIAIEDYINKQNTFYQKLQQDEIVLKLFTKNEYIHKYLHKITSTFLEIQIDKQLKYHRIIKINDELNFIKTENPSKEKREKMQKKIDERKNTIETATKKMFEKYDSIAPIINQFRERCKEQIYKILEPEH